MDNALSEYQTRRYQVENQTFQLDKSGMRHILERHSPEYWDGSTKTAQTFFRSGTTPENIQNIVSDVLRQNRNVMTSILDSYERSLVGNSGGANYQISIYQGRITSVVPLP